MNKDTPNSSISIPCMIIIGEKGKEFYLKEGENQIHHNDLMVSPFRQMGNPIMMTIYLLKRRSALIRINSQYPLIIKDNGSKTELMYFQDCLIKYKDMTSIRIVPFSFQDTSFLFKDGEKNIETIDLTTNIPIRRFQIQPQFLFSYYFPQQKQQSMMMDIDPPLQSGKQDKTRKKSSEPTTYANSPITTTTRRSQRLKK